MSVPVPLADAYGRHITYLRVSVTDRCQMRCDYCRTRDQVFMPREEILSLEEIERACSAFVSLGIRKIRITGGEPLVRRDVMRLFQRLGAMLSEAGLDELTLTSNGALLDRYASELSACGVRRVNVSLDTLDEKRFHAITGSRILDQVLSGIVAARKTGLKVKINAVVLPGTWVQEVSALIQWCGRNGHDLTLIETMPMGRWGGQGMPGPSLHDLKDSLADHWTLTPLSSGPSDGPGSYVRVGETGGRLGFIAPLSGNFCHGCNRVRLTSEGKLRLCLGRGESVDLRPLLRRNASLQELRQVIKMAMGTKPQSHGFLEDADKKHASFAAMNAVGG